VVIDAWCQKQQINWVHYDCLPNKAGVCAARNNGVDRAKGELLVFLDSDDQLLPDALAHIKGRFDQQEELDIYYGAIKMKSGALGYLPKISSRECLLDFEHFISLKGQGEYLQVCRRSVIENPEMRFCNDVNGFESILWMRALLAGAKLWIDSRPVRLYDDLRLDRLSHPKNLQNDSTRLALGFLIFFKEFGGSINAIEPKYWNSLLLRVVFYNKVSGFWNADLAGQLSVELSKAPLKLKLLAKIPNIVFHLLYPLINRFRVSKFRRVANN
jgi:glycosyltransferase involved in cell wall biosynthesis